MAVKFAKLTVLASTAIVLVFSFQNCGPGFKPSPNRVLSSLCSAKVKAAAKAEKFSAAQLNCAEFNNYSCERRIFSPNTSDLSHSLKECILGDSICVDVVVRQFNTEGARTSATPESYLPGGEFNREDIHCFHRMQDRGVALFEGRADSLESSLSVAMASCEDAVKESP